MKNIIEKYGLVILGVLGVAMAVALSCAGSHSLVKLTLGGMKYYEIK